MLTTLKSGTTVHFSGIPIHVCTDVEVEVEESSVPGLSAEEAIALNIPCTLRHHQPPMSAAPLPPARESRSNLQRLSATK
jgi:hypothetical protein